MDIIPGNSYALSDDTNFEGFDNYMNGLKSYWINKINEMADNNLLILQADVDTAKQNVTDYCDDISSYVHSYPTTVSSSLNYKFKKFLTIYIAYVTGKDYKSYSNDDLPVPSENDSYSDLSKFFTGLSNIYFPKYSEIFVLTDNTSTTSTTGAATITCVPSSTGNTFKTKLTTMLDVDESKLDEFMNWYVNQSYGFDISLWVVFKIDKEPNLDLPNMKPLRDKVLEDYRLQDVIDFYNFNIPGV